MLLRREGDLINTRGRRQGRRPWLLHRRANDLPDCRSLGVDVAVVYHGGDTEKYLDEVGGLKTPLLMHLAEEDEFISKPAQEEIKAALAGKPNATVYSYPGQHHAFARHNGAHYDASAAALANGRTHDFLNRELR